jgi:hypothetical protein
MSAFIAAMAPDRATLLEPPRARASGARARPLACGTMLLLLLLLLLLLRRMERNKPPLESTVQYVQSYSADADDK